MRRTLIWAAVLRVSRLIVITRVIAGTGRLLLCLGLSSRMGKVNRFLSRSYASSVLHPHILSIAFLSPILVWLLLIITLAKYKISPSFHSFRIRVVTRGVIILLVPAITQSLPQYEYLSFSTSSNVPVCQRPGFSATTNKHAFSPRKCGVIAPWKRRIVATSSCNRCCEKSHQHPPESVLLLTDCLVAVSHKHQQQLYGGISEPSGRCIVCISISPILGDLPNALRSGASFGPKTNPKYARLKRHPNPCSLTLCLSRHHTCS